MIQVLKFYLFSFLENSFPEYEFPGNFQLVQYNQQPPSYEEISQPCTTPPATGTNDSPITATAVYNSRRG